MEQLQNIASHPVSLYLSALGKTHLEIAQLRRLHQLDVLIHKVFHNLLLRIFVSHFVHYSFEALKQKQDAGKS